MKYPTTIDDVLDRERVKMQVALRRKVEVETAVQAKVGKVQILPDAQWQPPSGSLPTPTNLATTTNLTSLATPANPATLANLAPLTNLANPAFLATLAYLANPANQAALANLATQATQPPSDSLVRGCCEESVTFTCTIAVFKSL